MVEDGQKAADLVDAKCNAKAEFCYKTVIFKHGCSSALPRSVANILMSPLLLQRCLRSVLGHGLGLFKPTKSRVIIPAVAHANTPKAKMSPTHPISAWLFTKKRWACSSQASVLLLKASLWGNSLLIGHCDRWDGMKVTRQNPYGFHCTVREKPTENN